MVQTGTELSMKLFDVVCEVGVFRSSLVHVRLLVVVVGEPDVTKADLDARVNVTFEHWRPAVRARGPQWVTCWEVVRDKPLALLEAVTLRVR